MPSTFQRMMYIYTTKLNSIFNSLILEFLRMSVGKDNFLNSFPSEVSIRNPSHAALLHLQVEYVCPGEQSTDVSMHMTTQ